SLRSLWSFVAGAMASWHEGKLFIEHSVRIDHDALHILIGVLAWLVIGALLRRPLSSIRPWLWLLALIGWDGAADLWIEQWPEPGMQYGEGANDLILTMFIPTVLILAIRFAPGLFAGTKRR